MTKATPWTINRRTYIILAAITAALFCGIFYWVLLSLPWQGEMPWRMHLVPWGFALFSIVMIGMFYSTERQNSIQYNLGYVLIDCDNEAIAADLAETMDKTFSCVVKASGRVVRVFYCSRRESWSLKYFADGYIQGRFHQHVNKVISEMKNGETRTP